MSFPVKENYRGRFAPSPTGPLHFGSLVAAVASYLDAKHHSGKWLIRIDDIDHQRCKSEYIKPILKTIEAFGLEWDEEIVYQQQRHHLYQNALETLQSLGLTYRCVCTRKILPNGPYPGTCQEKQISDSNSSIRVSVDKQDIIIKDLIQPEFRQNLLDDVGDFVIYRADKMFSYHLATVIDDHEANITHIIRGADLLDSTPRQVFLQHLLNYQSPQYGHIPVAANKQGEKLSKQTYAKSVETHNIQQQLIDALTFLGQSVQDSIITESPKTILDNAIKNWDITKIPNVFSIMYESK